MNLPEPAIDSLLQILADRLDYSTLSTLSRLNQHFHSLVAPILITLEAEPMAMGLDRSLRWYRDGKLHRGFGQPAIIRGVLWKMMPEIYRLFR